MSGFFCDIMFVRLILSGVCKQFFILMAYSFPLYDDIIFYSSILLLMNAVVSRFCPLPLGCPKTYPFHYYFCLLVWLKKGRERVDEGASLESQACGIFIFAGTKCFLKHWSLCSHSGPWTQEKSYGMASIMVGRADCSWWSLGCLE